MSKYADYPNIVFQIADQLVDVQELPTEQNVRSALLAEYLPTVLREKRDEIVDLLANDADSILDSATALLDIFQLDRAKAQEHVGHGFIVALKKAAANAIRADVERQLEEFNPRTLISSHSVAVDDGQMPVAEVM